MERIENFLDSKDVVFSELRYRASDGEVLLRSDDKVNVAGGDDIVHASL
ncbi:hypothetical protein [Vulcanisaeta sp. JCM 14467]|nr:hypothetical protein [Vulcanisaeta sp. JCM 14467]